MENQPFLFSKTNGETHLLFCKSEDNLNLFFGHPYTLQPWRIWVRDPSGNEVNLNLQDENEEFGTCIIECNPHLFTRNSKLYLGYTAGFYKGYNTAVIYYHTTVEVDEDLNITGPTVVGQLSFSACFIGSDFFHAARGNPLGKDMIMKNDLMLPFDHYPIHIYRLCPIFGRDGFFILTTGQGQESHSWVVSTSGIVSREIMNSAGEPVYKCTILGDTLLYTLKDGPERSLIYDTVDSAALFA